MVSDKSNKELVLSEGITNLEAPAQMAKLSKTIAQVIVQSNLYTPIQGKNYVNVEGWQLAGALTGIYPKVEKVENLSQGNTYRYRAEVSLFNIKTKETVGFGTAICTNTEPGKKNFAEYAVASMAQTRAVGKAYRLALGWLLKLAGYETTPAEEMSGVVEGESIDEEPKAPSEKQLGYLKTLLRKLGKSDEEISEVVDKCQTSAQASAWIEKAKDMAEGAKDYA